MAKKKVTAKKTKATVSRSKKRSGHMYESYAIEHDFIIIAGGGLIVMVMVTLFLFGII
jgi:hypothetical protein